MGLGDFLNSADGWIEDRIAGGLSAVGIDSYENYLNEEAKAAQPQEHPSFWKAPATAGATAFGLASQIPGVNQAMTYLDYGRRAADTMLITAKHAGAASKGDDMESFGELLNGSNWAKAWDIAAMDNPNRVTGGQILASQAFGPDDQIEVADPFDAKEAEAIQNAAQGTWYGQTLAGVTDLATSFISPPGLGVATKVAKAGRAAKSVGTAADAEALAQHIATTGGAPKITKVQDTVDELLGKPRDHDSVLGRMTVGLRDLEGVTDHSQMMDILRPRMENTPDGVLVNMADDMVQINKTVQDPVLRDSMRVNYVLAGMGSNTARQMLMMDAPLLARSFENVTSKPAEINAITELYSQRLGTPGQDFTINEVLDKVYNTAGDKAEMDALRDHLMRAKQDAKDARALAAEIRSGKPAGGSQQWMEDKFAADALVRETQGEADLAAGFAKSKSKEIKGKKAEIKDLTAKGSPLNLANDMLNDLLLLGQDEATMISGRFEATALDSLKKNVRSRIGAEHLVTVGEGNTMVRVRSLPDRAAKMSLAPQARGSIALAETDLGRRQIGDALHRSGVYSKDEITAAMSKFSATKGYARQDVVAQLQNDMMERVAVKWFAEKKGLDLTPEEALKRAKEVTGMVGKAHGQGNQWVSRAMNEQVEKGLVMVKDADGPAVAFDEPMLRSHLADSAPMLDPWDFKRALDDHEASLVGNVKNGFHSAVGLHDMLLQAWKVGALLRPGLMVRAFLDTGPRALASLSAGAAFMASIDGAANVLHNTKLRGLAKIHVGGDVAEVATKFRALGLKPTEIPLPGGRKVTHTFAQDSMDLQSTLQATSKGNSVHGALFGDMSKAYNGMKIDRANWARRAADSQHWAVAYKEYAGMLLASPTARKVADLMAKKADEVTDVDALRRDIKNSDEFLAEWRQIAQPMGRTREQFLDHVIHEVGLMFPSERLLNAAKAGHLSKSMIDAEVPPNLRFDIPSPEISVVESHKTWEATKGLVDKAFRVLLDKPDMWMARNPVAVQLYNRGLRKEYDSLVKRFGPDVELTPQMQKAIDRKAKSEAVQYVRRTFFDTTRYTGAHRYAVRMSPFFAAWEDAMMSWGRLILDDPRRIVKLSAAYHVPETLTRATGEPWLVNQDGEPVKDGDEAFIQVPVKIAGVQNYRIRLGSLNSIFQGETWWLPGTGPTAQIPITYTLGNLVDRETALDIVGTDSWLGKQVLKSMYLDGELPASDPASLAQSTLPGWVRNLASETLGKGKVRNQQTTFNYLVADELANGKTLTESDYRALWDRAGKSANAAAVVRLVAGAGFGMTGTAAVDGQFYVDQMHIIQAMSPEQRGGLTADEFFSQTYPEAAELKWSITKNETGINATVHAAKAEARLAPLLKGNKEIGWMVLGRDNLVDPEFSRTAHALQRSDGNRTYESAYDTQQGAQAAVGWRQYNAWTEQALTLAKQQGLDENSPQYTLAKKTIRQYLMQSNAAWAREATESKRNFDFYYSQAVRLSSSGPLKDRSDMVAFQQYDDARAEVMDHFGIKSLSGTKPEYAAARQVLREAGNTLAKRDLGFQQMWDRFLEREVEEADAEEMVTDGGTGAL